jgi:hypothetical protein
MGISWGSRDRILITEDKKEEFDRPTEIPYIHSPKRPSSLPADVHTVSVKGKKWGVVVGLLCGKPFELFAGSSIELPLSDHVKEAYIKKNGSNRYHLIMKITDNKINEISDIRKLYDNDEQRVITRFVCRELRHGIPIKFIIRDLEDHKGSISNYSSALARVLKRYVQRPKDDKIRFVLS